MTQTRDQKRDWRRAKLFGPIGAMTISGLVLLVALSLFLIERFDVVAAQREQVLVEHGFARRSTN